MVPAHVGACSLRSVSEPPLPGLSVWAGLQASAAPSMQTLAYPAICKKGSTTISTSGASLGSVVAGSSTHLPAAVFASCITMSIVLVTEKPQGACPCLLIQQYVHLLHVGSCAERLIALHQ